VGPEPRSRARRAAAIALWALLFAGFAWAIVRLFGLERGFPLVAVITYTPYAALGALLLVLTGVVLRMWPAAIAAGATAALLLVAVVPRELRSDGSSAAAGGPSLRVMSANLAFGNADPEAVVRLVREERIDVLAVQELTPRAIAGLRKAGLEALLSERALFPDARASGGGLYARYPLRHVEEGSEVPGGFPMPRAQVRIDTDTAVGVVSVHPVPPTGSSEVELWEDGLRSLPPASSAGVPWILAGDFNATLDHAELRRILDAGYVDAADAEGVGLSPTWPSDRFPPPVTIDHVLADERIGIEDLSTHDLPGSDHRAVSAELLLPG
jgi:endonuclease/exonuclease/phosphatase family metal-dependent hydrolase